MVQKLTAIIKKGEKQYVALCLELDVVSQGYMVEEAICNLKEAIELYLEVEGPPEGISKEETLVTTIEVAYGRETAAVVG